MLTVHIHNQSEKKTKKFTLEQFKINRKKRKNTVADKTQRFAAKSKTGLNQFRPVTLVENGIQRGTPQSRCL